MTKVRKNEFDSALTRLLATPATPKKTMSQNKPKAARRKNNSQQESVNLKSDPHT
jgi:hypothetical protein